MCNHNMAFKNIDFQHLLLGTNSPASLQSLLWHLSQSFSWNINNQQHPAIKQIQFYIIRFTQNSVSLSHSVSELSRVSVTSFVSGSSLIPSSSVWATVESDLSNSCENLHPQPIFWWSGDEEILVPHSHQDQDQCWYMFNSSLTRSCSSLWQLRSVNNSSSRH